MPSAAVLNPALDPPAMRRARLTAGLTIYDVGTATGRDPATVAKYERGTVDPPASVLGMLAGLYRVDVGAFYTGGDR